MFTLGVLSALSVLCIGCNSRRFVSAETVTGNAFGDSKAADSQAGDSRDTDESARSGGVTVGGTPTATSSGVSTTRDVMSRDAHGSGAVVDGETKPIGSTGDTLGSGVGETFAPSNEEATNSASNATVSASAPARATELDPETSGDVSRDVAPVVPASAAERDALIAELATCVPGETAPAPSAIRFDFDALSATRFASGVLTFGDAERPLEAVLAYYDDQTGDYELALTAGAEQTAHALRASNSAASGWGGGIALVMSCFDASQFEGVEFWVRGETPAGSFVFGIDTGDDTSATVELLTPGEWSYVRVPFSNLQLTGDAAGAWPARPGGGGFGGNLPNPNPFDPSDVRALVWSSQLRYSEQPPGSANWEAETGAYEIVVDDVRFY